MSRWLDHGSWIIFFPKSSGAEGAWSGDVDVVAEYFQPEGPIMKGLIRGQYPSHWIATKRSDKEVDVWGTVTLKVKGGGTYTAYVHEYMQFYEPCVKINRHYWLVSWKSCLPI